MGANDIIGAVQTIAALGAFRDRARENVKKAIKELTFRLVAHVKEDKLSDQVLRVRTGRLRRSITKQFSEQGDSFTGIVGTNVSYAAVHEYGFKGTVNIRGYMRTAKTVFGRQLKAPITFPVRAHARSVNLPERSFLRSALADMKPEIDARISAAVREAANA